MTDRTKSPGTPGDNPSRAHEVAPEHRWHTVVATLIALALYALLPSSVTVAVRYTVVAVCVALLIPLIVYNPHHFTRESKWSRRLELGIATLLLVANLFAFAEVVVLLLQKSQNGGTLLLASVQVWITNVIAFALLYWGMDRGGPVSRVTVPRPNCRLQISVFRRMRTTTRSQRSPPGRRPRSAGCRTSSTTCTSRCRTRWRSARPTRCRCRIGRKC